MKKIFFIRIFLSVMKKSITSFVFIFFSGCLLAQKSNSIGCRDSSMRLQYLIANPYNDFGETNSLVLQDGSSVKIAHCFVADKVNSIVSKFNKNYNLQWSYRYGIPSYNLAFLNSKELSTGEILITGHTGKDPSLPDGDTTARYFIMLLDSKGNIIWQQSINHAASHQSDWLKTKYIAEKNGEIYLLLNDDGFVHLLNIHHNGTFGWCKTFTNYGLEAGANGLFINNNYLDLLLMAGGGTISGTPCTGMYVAKIDITNGNILVQKDYCYDISSNSIESPVWQSVKTDYNQYILTVAHDNSLADYDFTVLYFDTSLTPVKTMRIKKIKPVTVQGSTGNCITIDKNGKILITSYWDDNITSNNGLPPFANKIAYAIIDSSGRFLLQKKAIATTSNNDFMTHGFSHYFLNPGVLNRSQLSYYYQSNGNTYIDYYDLSDSINTSDNCLGYDSSIFSLSYTNNTQVSWSFDSIYNNHFESRNSNVIVSPFFYIKTEICKKLVVCDTLIISGPNTICLGTETVQYKIHKNPLCDKKIKISIDSNYCSIIQNTGDSILQVKFIKPGKTKLYASIENCVLKDSLEIVLTEPKTSFSIAKDSLLCPGKNLLLQGSKGFASYRWQDGTASDNFLVIDTGFYKVTATDSCGNIFLDSIRVKFSDTAFTIAPTATICNTDTLKLQVPLYFFNVAWQPFSNALYTGEYLQFFPSQTTVYTISLESSKNCRTEKQINIQVNDCPANIFFPNSFTPNGDKKNDIFKPSANLPLQYYQLAVYNRFGQKMFETNNSMIGWNGKYKDVFQDAGTFIYYCTYKFINRPTLSKKGYCILIR